MPLTARRAPVSVRRVNLWIPDRTGHDEIGVLPDGVSLGLIPPDGPLPDAILDAEFIVPGAGDRRVLERLDEMAHLRVVQTLSAGVDWALSSIPAGVTLCDAGGARDIPVAEWVLAAILASTKTFPELRDDQREHRWQWRRSGELAGSVVMILGHGAIGEAVEARLAPFGVELIRVARTARPGVHATADLKSLLPRADVVVVLLPLTPATTGLLDADLLGRLPHGALLVNAARGPIVDTAALLERLQAGELRAALDVTDPEPLPAAHPLWDAPAALITPHFAGDTLDGDRRAFILVGEQVRRYVSREPLVNIVHDGY
jgi:phosphoglycerate dehydrogenase-like enzyme